MRLKYERAQNQELHVSITWDRQVYHVGEEVACTITLANSHKQPILARTSHAQTYTRKARTASDEDDKLTAISEQSQIERSKWATHSDAYDDRHHVLSTINPRSDDNANHAVLVARNGLIHDDLTLPLDVQGARMQLDTSKVRHGTDSAFPELHDARVSRLQDPQVSSFPLNRESLDLKRHTENHFRRATLTMAPPRPGRRLSGETRLGQPVGKHGRVIQQEPPQFDPVRDVQELSNDYDHDTASINSDSASTSNYRSGGNDKSEHRPVTPVANSDRQSLQRLMMGTVQLLGMFEPDTSLIDASPFEDIRWHAVNQASGGVVGVQRNRRDSSFLKTLGLGSISSAFGNPLSSRPSTIDAMEKKSKSQQIPIITTPQSVLFVGLDLQAGEQMEYRYTYRLPAVLPPTYKGRAIRVWYSLSVGVQLATSEGIAQNFKQFDAHINIVPTPVVRHANSTLSRYDFLQPHLISMDAATVLDHSIKADKSSTKPVPIDIARRISTYASEILETNTGSGQVRHLLSSDTCERPIFSNKEKVEQLDRVDSTLSDVIGASPNIYHIRKGQTSIATIRLLRTNYSLGEEIIVHLSLSDQTTTCHGLVATLETAEHVNPDFALRSPNSIDRATKRIYDTWARPLSWNRSLVCGLTIPSSAPATFETSLIDLVWRVRLEFFVSPGHRAEEISLGDNFKTQHPIVADDRGLIDRLASSQDVVRAEILLPIAVQAP